ncbi:MAG: hypothetical protein AAGH88_03250 [Planctomycetota bacterium]
MNDSNNLPVHREQMGSISASVWMNQTEAGEPFYVTTLSRTYRDPDSGEWKDANSFGQRDLLVIALVAQRAALKISELNQADRRGGNGQETASERTQETAEVDAAAVQEQHRSR